MSWDVLLVRLGTTPVDDGAETSPLGDAREVRNHLRSALPDLDFSDPSWGVLAAEDWSIEFNLDPDGPVDSIMLHVRGGDGAVAAVHAAAAALGASALDCSSGDVLEQAADPRESLRRWRAYRDELLGDEPGLDESGERRRG